MADNPFDRNSYPEITPDSVVMGSFIGWRLDLDYDNSDYSLRYELTPVGATNDNDSITVSGSRVTLDDGTWWVFEIDTATSNAFTITSDTEYRWDLVLVDTATSNATSIRSGFARVFLSFSDRKSHAEIMFSQLNALLEGRARSDVSSYSIKSRSLTKLSIEELMKWRDYYANEIRRTGGTVVTGKKRVKTNTVQVRFK